MAASIPTQSQHGKVSCCVHCYLEALGVGYFFLTSDDIRIPLAHPAILHCARAPHHHIRCACHCNGRAHTTTCTANYQWCTCMCNDTLAERLRRRPAKPMGSPRVGSNPAGVAVIYGVHCTAAAVRALYNASVPTQACVGSSIVPRHHTCATQYISGAHPWAMTLWPSG